MSFTKETIQEKSNITHNNEYELIGDYNGMNSKISTLHKECGYVWDMNLNNHIYKKRGCPKCSKTSPLTIEDIQERSDSIHKYDYKIIEVFKKGNRKHIKLSHTCDHTFFMSISNHLNLKQGCPKCYKKEKLTIDIIKERIFNMYRNEYKLLSNNYKNIETKLTIRHNKCSHIWNITANNFLNNKRKCPNCYKPDKYTIETIQEKSNIIHNNEYTILSENYINSNNKISIKHNICGHIWEVFVLNHLNKSTGCPKCFCSKGESEIVKFLEENNIKHIREYKFEDCISDKNYPFRFDFYCPNINTCIEYDGELHFKSIEHFGGDGKLLKTMKNDELKNIYCKDNNINLIRIPYTQFNYINKILIEKILNS